MADGTDVSNVVESKQYIDVMINNEQYGIDINFIDNIVRMQRITRVPKAQDYFPGVINLRGEIIPVMSLRRRFGFEDDVFTPKTRILILKPEPQASIGFIVDEVKEVINIKEEEIDRVVTSEDKNTFIAGVGKHTKGLVSILNISAVLQDKEQD
ncbi:MAG: purine-binding chemotaxis protein CheW [Lachnospiraceae bacterium]|jgi:purine-binding chemotaxis protein CheW|nr:purine-binding chemotaxis protein CheW [Lachnospiraceae bacterium]